MIHQIQSNTKWVLMGFFVFVEHERDCDGDDDQMLEKSEKEI